MRNFHVGRFRFVLAAVMALALGGMAAVGVQAQEPPNAPPELFLPGHFGYSVGDEIDPLVITIHDPEGDFMLTSVGGLPIGLTLAYGSTATSTLVTISGQIDPSATVGDYTITVTAEDPTNPQVSGSFPFLVLAPSVSLAVGDYLSASTFLLDSANRNPTGFTWDGTYFRVVDIVDVKVYSYTAAGVYTPAADFNLDPDNDSAVGIGWNGSTYCTVDLGTDDMYCYTAAGVYIGTVGGDLQPGNNGPGGITWNGTHWYVVDGDDNVYVYTSTGVYSTSFPLSDASVNPSGITWDGTHFHVAEDALNEVHAYTSTFVALPTLDFNTESPDNWEITGLTNDGSNLYVLNDSGNTPPDDKIFAYEGPNAPPQITNPGDQTYAQGETITALDITVTDADAGNTVEVTLSGLPSGLNYSGGQVSGTVSATATVQDYTVTITASDGIGADVTEDFTVTITAPPNTSPVVTAPADKTYYQGEPIVAFAITVTDAEQTPAVTVTGLPSGLAYSSGQVSGTISQSATAQSYTVSIEADDGIASPVTADFTILIEAITADSIAVQTGEVIRALFIAGGATTWYSRRAGANVGSASGDITFQLDGEPTDITRIFEHVGLAQLRINTGGGLSAYFGTGGPADDAELRLLTPHGSTTLTVASDHVPTSSNVVVRFANITSALTAVVDGDKIQPRDLECLGPSPNRDVHGHAHDPRRRSRRDARRHRQRP